MNIGCVRFFLWLLILFVFSSCGGGNNTGVIPPPPLPPPPTSGASVSGKLIVPPTYQIEVEPNHSIAKAQSVSSPQAVFGAASINDPKFIIPERNNIDIQDLYRLTTNENVRITLTIAANDLRAVDLDLFLMDENGRILAVSEGLVSTEELTVIGPGTFLIGIRAFEWFSSYVVSIASLGDIASTEGHSIPPTAEFVPGEILMKWKTGTASSRQKSSSEMDIPGIVHRKSFPDRVELITLAPLHQPLQKPNGLSKFGDLATSNDHALKVETLNMIKQLQGNPDVEYAEPNFIRKKTAIPDDTRYPTQWHYALMNLPQAWDVTTGDNSVVVAVLDTGAPLNHTDLTPRLIAGYDFISDLDIAGDGDGVDSDPTDIGDDPRKQSSSFHGTHVAGTIGAATNNGIGVAGVTWQSQIMPIRVLGIGGGTDADITQAIRYAAGLTNSSGALPAQQARVINMSLGGPGFSQTQQDAITAARAQGVIIVAAAGNENSSEFSYPASFDGVISVAAVDMASQRAPYSSFGRRVDVAAPGGNSAADLNGDQFADGVLSTVVNDKGEMSFDFYQGTSMATPHVAGVMALMLAVNPDLTPTDIDLLISGTHPNSSRRITLDRGVPGRDDFYGHGLLDAFQAVTAANEVPGGIVTLPIGSVLSVSPSAFSFDNFLDTIPLTITNAGSGTLNITSIASNASWLTTEIATGTAPLTTVLRVNRRGLPDGVYNATLTIMSDATLENATRTISVKMKVGGPTAGNVGTVFVLALDETTFNPVAEARTTAAKGYSFSTTAIPPGKYFFVAGTDRDNDDFICDIEDACGYFPTPVTVLPNQVTSGITFVLGELNSPQNANEAVKHLQGKTFQRLTNEHP